ncbi:MAG: hypothetical protein FJ098_12810, partial [Deltaproteobacteria bacterium]|nr:hypothetical protein [Deltaproteobacteria bacterium]
PPGSRLCRYPLEDLGNAARALVEQEALAAALEAPVEDAAAGLQRVLGLRLGRYSSSPDGDRIRIIEDWEERLEGTAKFVEERFVAEAGLAGEGQAALLDLARRLRSLAPEDLQKWRYYRTGEGLLRLLERLPEGPGWHHAVELGAAPSDAALERMARDPPEPLEPEEAALEAARRRVEPRIRAALAEEERLLAEWPRQGSLHVVLVADSGAAVNYSARGVTFHLPDCSRFIGYATAFVDRRAGLEVRDRSVLLDADRDVARYRVEFFGDPAEGDFLLVDDAPPRGPGPHPFSSSIRIRGSGWKLDHHGAGSLEVLPDGLRIDLLLESGAS